MRGKYEIKRLPALPQELEDLYGTPAFLLHDRGFNSLFTFTALNAAPLPTWTEPPPPSMLQLHGRAYHRIFDANNDYNNESTPPTNHARMYIYDASRRQRAEQLSLDSMVVDRLQQPG